MTTAKVINMENAAKDLHHKKEAARKDREEKVKALIILIRIGIALAAVGFIIIAGAVGGSDAMTLTEAEVTVNMIVGTIFLGIGTWLTCRCEKYAKINRIKRNEYF